MSGNLDPDRQREWFDHLQRIVEHRAQETDRIEATFATASEAEVTAFTAAHDDLRHRFESEARAVQQLYDADVSAAHADHARETARIQEEYDEEVRRLREACERDCKHATLQHEEASWLVSSVFDDESEDSPKQRYEIFRSRMNREREFLGTQKVELDSVMRQAHQSLEQRRQACDDPLPAPTIKLSAVDELRDAHVAGMDESRNLLQRLQSLWLPRQFAGIRPLFVFVIVFSFVFPLALVGTAIASHKDVVATLQHVDQLDQDMLVVSGGAAAVFSMLICLFVYLAARGQSLAVFHALQQSAADTDACHQFWLGKSKTELKRQRIESKRWHAELIARRQAAKKKADDKLHQQLTAARGIARLAADEANRQRPQQLESQRERRDRRLRAAESRYPSQLQSMTSRFDSRLALMQSTHDRQIEAIAGEYHTQWARMSAAWFDGIREFSGFNRAIIDKCHDMFPDWREMVDSGWDRPEAIPQMIPVGDFRLDLARFDRGVPTDERLAVKETAFVQPALLRFPEDVSMTIKAAGDGRTSAVAMMQSVMLRLLTSIPPGKIRFTIMDPVGLGENFSAFMHLVDYDELLVNSRIWTDAIQIDKRLQELTEHMQNVFQAYLRNEFATIQEYNQHAGEVAEPYHVLVVANFPAGFSEESVRRLLSIVGSGPRCGVHTLISVDTRLPVPFNMDLSDLEQGVTSLLWQDGRFEWKHPVVRNAEFLPAAAPDPGVFSEVVRAVGEQSRDARHVEVAFDRIAPKIDRIWSSSTRHGIDVPLGRAGATKLQFMRLGRGTSQHALIAGKTGSGKSTLLHILITNLALHYSPDEMEFFLIDFKKGVEFKTYVTNRLPHARVVAIESDREFGVSVLERLDEILRERGDRFRAAGVQDIASFRELLPDELMPRILLVIDEFQEFFVDDDATSQRASLLLDRLVRQGRAFGMHVLLGSQTLGGAYSLARSTMGQIAVRIALQCSESDAHLILSEDNMAARLLTRPGEAIYNDANGLIEGNHPFQIAWLGDDRRESWLSKLHGRDGIRDTPTIVFEGNIPANAELNRGLATVIAAEDKRLSPAVARIWLGDPVAIREPTEVALRRQSGHNMLIVGQSDQLALGVGTLSLISLAAQIQPAGLELDDDLSQFYVFTETVDAGSSGPTIWQAMKDCLPHRVRIVEPGDVATVLSDVSTEIERRSQLNSAACPPVYLVINGLSRFRDLRKDDDDFGMGSFDNDKPAGPGRMFGEILRNGPATGLHTIAWSDTYSNVTRWLSSTSMREFEIRIAFQMNGTDSANFVDTPAASRLGVNRALLYREETGKAEVFRPYSPPDIQWLQQIGLRLGQPAGVEIATDSLDGWTIT